jgi:hypothetical protein
MKLSRLVLNLLLVAVFGFLNAFMIQNYGQSTRAGEKDTSFPQVTHEVVTLEMAESNHTTEYNL